VILAGDEILPTSSRPGVKRKGWGGPKNTCCGAFSFTAAPGEIKTSLGDKRGVDLSQQRERNPTIRETTFAPSRSGGGGERKVDEPHHFCRKKRWPHQGGRGEEAKTNFSSAYVHYHVGEKSDVRREKGGAANKS